MSKKLTAMVLGAAISALAMAAASAAPADAAYKVPLNAYGQPDLEGTWTNATLTTLERPKEYGTRLIMTPEEVKKVEGDDAKIYAADAAPRDPKFKTTDLPQECGKGSRAAACGYTLAWIDPGTNVRRVSGEPRASFITDPADGRLPPTKPGVVAENPYLHYGENPEN